MKKTKREWQTFGNVMTRYNIPYSSLLSVRLKRFGKHKFPQQRGPAGRKILRLKVTKELHEYLERLR